MNNNTVQLMGKTFNVSFTCADGMFPDSHKLSAGGFWAEVLHRMMGNITVMSGEAETPRLTWKRTQNIQKKASTLCSSCIKT